MIQYTGKFYKDATMNMACPVCKVPAGVNCISKLNWMHTDRGLAFRNLPFFEPKNYSFYMNDDKEFTITSN